MNLKGKNVFVTGADGFIGSHLVQQLVKEGAHVRAMVQYNAFGSWGNLEYLPKDILTSAEIYMGDIRDPLSTSEGIKGCDVVFHLAALIAIPYSYQAPESYIQTNILGTLNVLQASRAHSVGKIVHTSTSETYGTALYKPIDEAHPLQGQSPYSASKIGADKMAESYFLSFGLPVATIRPFNTYGPRQSARAVIPTIISQILSSKKGEIKLGALSPSRDFTYVLDTVEGFLSVAKSDASVGQVINIGSGQKITIGDTANLIIELMAKTSDISIICDKNRIRPEKSEVIELLCDSSKAQKLCGWKTRYSLKEGLKETISFFEKNLEKYKTNIYNV